MGLKRRKKGENMALSAIKAAIESGIVVVISKGYCPFCRRAKVSYFWWFKVQILWEGQRYTYRVLQTIQMKLILLCVWAERAVLGSAKTALEFEYEIQIG